MNPKHSSDEPADGQYAYFAWMDDDNDSVDDARQVIREWTSPQGYHLEERYTHDFRWVTSGLRDEFISTHKSGYLMPITEQNAEQFKEIVAKRRKASKG